MLPTYYRNRIEANPEGCWIWTGSLHKAGYGEDRHSQKDRGLAHRKVYELLVGEIPDGMILHHRCEVKSCVNPNHLELTIQSDHAKHHMPENIAGIKAAAIERVTCKHGHSFSDVRNVYLYRGWRLCRTCRRIQKHRKEGVAISRTAY